MITDEDSNKVVKGIVQLAEHQIHMKEQIGLLFERVTKLEEQVHDLQNPDLLKIPTCG